MFPRFVRFVTCLAAVVFAYFAYRLALVPFIEPAAKPRAAAAEVDATLVADTRTQQLQSLFPPGSWERERPKVLDTDRAVLLLRDVRELDEYRLESKLYDLTRQCDRLNRDTGLAKETEGCITQIRDIRKRMRNGWRGSTNKNSREGSLSEIEEVDRLC